MESKHEIDQLLTEFRSSFRDLNFDRFRACFSDGPTVFFPRLPYAELVETEAEFERAWSAVFSDLRKQSPRRSPPYFDLDPREPRTRLIGTDAAIATFHLSDPVDLCRRSVVLERLPEGWKIVHLHASNIARLTDEFDDPGFADNYEALSDAFIDIRATAQSFMRIVPEGATIFEIGVGTGYFARQLGERNYQLCGIEKSRNMLRRLSLEWPEFNVEARVELEKYEFMDQHGEPRKFDAIVSHSSVFLFTRVESSAASGETIESLVFQSFIRDEQTALENLKKVVEALAPQGRLLINTQTNPPPRIEVGRPEKRFIYDQIRCVYNFETRAVEKTTYAGYLNEIRRRTDIYFIVPYADFARYINNIGGYVQLSSDRRWVIVTRPTEAGGDADGSTRPHTK